MIGSPTWNEEVGIDPFTWSNAQEECRTHSHYLIPEIFKYDWTEYNSEFDF